MPDTQQNRATFARKKKVLNFHWQTIANKHGFYWHRRDICE